MLTLFEQGGSDFSLSRLQDRLPDQGARDALAELAVQPVPAGDAAVLIAHFADRLKLIWVQKRLDL
jgi:hypothetical protein